MSTESLFGGGANDLIDANDRALLDILLLDLFNSTSTAFDGGQLVQGDGPGGEKQGALTPGTGELEGVFQTGELSLEIYVPAGLGLTFTGKDSQDEAAAESYLNKAIDAYFPAANVDPSTPEGQQQLSLTNAVDDLLGSLGGGKDISVRLIDFLGKGSVSPQSALLTTTAGADMLAINAVNTLVLEGSFAPQAAGVATNEILFDAGATKGKQVFVLNLTKVGTDKTVVVKNVEAVLVGGAGNLRVDGTTGVRVNSDNIAQKITGGGGNDTLVGGGNDTLTGGVGADIFGFSSAAKGKFTITDFNKSMDQIGLKLTGVTTFEQLKAAVTGASFENGATTYNLGPDISITLVGIGYNEISDDMIKFTF